MFNFGRGTSAANVSQLDARGLQELLQNGSKPFLLDVREPFELKAFGAVPGVVNIPLGEISSRMNELPSDKNAQIVVICQSGNRSRSAAKALVKSGFSNVLNLEGGTMGWLRATR